MARQSFKAKQQNGFLGGLKWHYLPWLLCFVFLAYQSIRLERYAATNYDNNFFIGTATAATIPPIGTQLDYGLAFRESLGFFDDISANHWKIIKAISKARVHHLNKLQGYDKFYAENWDPDFSCMFEDSIGQSEADGHKWVCDPHRLRSKDDCLIYSIGCNGQIEFERDMHRVAPNCEIHIFDPTDYSKSMWDNGLNGTNYHAWGLKPSTGFDLSQVQDKVKDLTFKTLTESMEQLGHIGRRVDVFKIDCEFCEWKTYPDFLHHDLRQILLEVHNAIEPKLFETLTDAGYVIFHKEPNLFTDGQGIEFSMLKLAKEFFD
ncbi:methyltransferase domain-containing protein [Fragilaria crotonensis]|nr:methyltransferase domain-containing protein [Fragilaria crotonensis]